MELIDHERKSLDALGTVGTLVSPRSFDLPRFPPWAVPNGWDYWGRPWAYIDASSNHSEMGVSSALTPPSTRVMVAVLVACPHEPQFLPDLAIAQSASVAAGRATGQARPLTPKGELQDNLKLKAAAKWLLPRGYGNGYSAAVLDQLKSWETFRMLSVGQRENPPMPTGDVIPPECAGAQASENFSGCPIVTGRVAETTCRSQATSSATVAADRKLQQQPVIHLPKLGGEKLKSISSTGSTRQPRASTPVEGVSSRPPETESMEVVTSAVQATSQHSVESMATHPATQEARASQTQPRLTGPRSRPDLNTKQHATDQQGVRNIVVGVLESQGMGREDWEKSLRTDYKVEPLPQPTWVVHKPSGQHLATMESAPVGQWRVEPNVTSDQLFRQLTQLAKGTSQACSY